MAGRLPATVSIRTAEFSPHRRTPERGYAVPRRRLAPALAGLAAAAFVSLRWPAYHFVVLSHLHNVVPLFLLWEWSRRLPDRPRAAFRAVQLGWVLAVPALLLSGLLDPLLTQGTAAVTAFAGTPAVLSAPVVPPGVQIGLRFLAVFAFLQAMHHVVWLRLLPWQAPEAVARFEARVPWLRGWRPWALGGGAAAVLGLVFSLDYVQGRTLYQAFASYHAYLEFPVLLALLFARRGDRAAEAAPLDVRGAEPPGSRSTAGLAAGAPSR